MKLCECGCGIEVKKRFAHSHNPPWNKGKIIGKQSEETKQKRSLAIKARIAAGTFFSPLFDPVIRAKGAASVKGRVPWNKGISTPHLADCNHCIWLAKHRNEFPRPLTQIEAQLYAFLSDGEIVFEAQKRFGKYSTDAFVPSLNLIIEADGCYWHGCADCGFKGQGDDVKEAAREAFLKKRYELFRVPEHAFLSGDYKAILASLLGKYERS